ncbi:acyltransferase family protein [Bizionia psychrotolerans]|uniref:acyltransferase family protein n=1 Tax=Bizionia psychrotolerans TaxID=1492901 RepID=UPI000650A1CF|nr:acyltransferase family protein [Bizionia psychrotolerans]
MDTNSRRYDLDWLRVIAILAVYFHHLCMPFNGDDFHIMNAESSKLLDDIMVFFEQVRLPLLFLISGTGTVLAFSKRTWKHFF